ncbi:MAG: STAS domain-containing protein [Planctomycetes bacterium]|nr:STAS domain-containing protein [Planctomycetota bacterium]
MLKRITEKLKKAWAEAAPPSSGSPAKPNPFARIVGRLNLRNAAVLRRNLFRLLYQRNRCIALDCSQIRFMDGSALAVLLEFATTCKDTGVNLLLLEPSSQMCSAFSMYGLDDVLMSLGSYEEIELDGLLIVLEEDFAESIRLPALLIEGEDLAEAIQLPTIDADDYRQAA